MAADLDPPTAAGSPPASRNPANLLEDAGSPTSGAATPGSPPAADGTTPATAADGTPAAGRIARARSWITGEVERISSWFERRRIEAVPYDLAAMYYERDRDAFASVLGAALAMRLFLFLVPFLVFIVGLVLLVFGPDGLAGALDNASVTGTIAEQIRGASPTSRSGGLVLMITGVGLSLWAGRSLTAVLASCAAGAWRITGRASRATLRMAGTVTGLIMLLLLVSVFLNRVRADFSLPVATTSWVAAASTIAVGWFAVTWSLPRRTTDPGALLPGAVVMGIGLSAVQWFMQYYLPARVERASELVGSIGVTLAALGYLFVVGRLMASSLILNAIVWERVGSITGLVFALPVVRLLPPRSAWVRRFFDLDGDRDGDVTSGDGGGEPGSDDRRPAAGADADPPPTPAPRPGG